MIRNPRASNEQLLRMLDEKKVKDEIYSFFPVDKYGCECMDIVNDLKTQLASLNEKDRKALKKKIGHVVCPKSRQPGYRRYRIVCANCGEIVAFVAAKDKDLTDWCDLHYYNYARLIKLKRTVRRPLFYQRGPKKGQPRLDRKGRQRFELVEEILDTARWYGCATVNISPIDQKLGFECFCGNDTRDFRSSATLPPAEIHAMLAKREFNRLDSGYIVQEVKG